MVLYAFQATIDHTGCSLSLGVPPTSDLDHVGTVIYSHEQELMSAAVLGVMGLLGC